MKQRLLKITGGKAGNVMIKTFHSFAAEIMNIYPDYFWNSAKLSTAPDAVVREIIDNILSGLPLDNPLALKFYGKFTVTKSVADALKLTKEAGLTPSKLKAIIEANLRYIDVIEPQLCDILSDSLSYKKLAELKTKIDNLPDQEIDQFMVPLISLSTLIKDSLNNAINADEGTGKTKNTGDWKKRFIQTVGGVKGMHDERKRNQWWLYLAEVYDKYRRHLHKRGFYDYSDMLVEVISQLEQNPELLANVQERFQHVMIDEFQDTNAAQLRLAHLVAYHHSTEGKPNIMAVGDDDQSIFKFNGAELSNILSFEKTYPSTKIVVLKQNYRSHQAILDLSAKVMSQADDRITKRRAELDKDLVSETNIDSYNIQHLKFKTAEDQLHAIASLIAKQYNTKESFAVIARSHSSLVEIADILKNLNIPINYEQQRNILLHPLVDQTILLANLSKSINTGALGEQNFYLSKLLVYPSWDIPAKTLWQLAITNTPKNWLEKLLVSEDENLQKLANFFLELAKKLASCNLHQAIEYLVGLRPITTEAGEVFSPLKSYYNNSERDLNEYLYGLSAIRTLRGLVSEYSANQDSTLEDYIKFITIEKNSGTIINDESPFVNGEHSVSLLTVHKAKGLEFDNVYIIDATDDNWSPGSARRKPPANLPLQPTGDDMDDYIRLMFTAITRAKSGLIISSYLVNPSGRNTIPTPIIESILPGQETDHSSEVIQVLEQTLSWPRLGSANEKLILKSRLDNYSLSVTHLFNFLDISGGGPQKFLERNILQLPDVKSASLAYGTAIHNALELAQNQLNADGLDASQIKNAFTASLKAEYLPYEEEKRYLEKGLKDIDRIIINDNLVGIKPGASAEQKLSSVSLGEARLNGKIDRLEQTEGKIIVSDYKTDKTPLTSFNTADKTKQAKVWRAKTQLTYYALLLQSSGHINTDGKEIIGQMIYTEATRPQDCIKSYTPTSTDIDELKKLIGAVWNKIIDLDLPDISGYTPDHDGTLRFIKDLTN